MPITPEELIARNRAWVDRKVQGDPSFFARLAHQQTPEYFWIGCSDSRVPATEIVDLDPGEMFVHRNVANVAAADDPNFAAALVFAVDVLRVRHVIVTGHYGCGGIGAAMTPDEGGPVNAWISPIREHYHRHGAALDAIPDMQARSDRLCELHVMEQIDQLSRNPVIVDAWTRRGGPMLHGWVYDIRDGLIRSICTRHP